MTLSVENTAIVIDSTADFPEAPRRFANWRMVPLYVRFGDESRKDYVEMTAHWFTGAGEPAVFSEANDWIGSPGFRIRNSASYASAVYSGVFCLLGLRGARDWRRREAIQLQELQDHHIFPQAYLKRRGPNLDLVSRVIGPQRPVRHGIQQRGNREAKGHVLFQESDQFIVQIGLAVGDHVHHLKLGFARAIIPVFFNQELLFEAEHITFPKPGKVGLWTKADRVTYFDDFTVVPKEAQR